MIAKILIAGAAILVVLVAVIATRPSEFREERSATMSAPSPVVFAPVNDIHNWEAGSPYAKRDPGMKKSFEGAPAGVGAKYAWSGHHELGEGRTTIIESRPSELIRVELEFVRPFAGTSTATFTFRPEGERTAVTWSLDGRNSFPAKAMGLVMNMDRMIGDDFEKGLAQMKTIAEAAPRS
jgi:hypothetical protein